MEPRQDNRRKLLPFLDTRHGGRSHMTCLYRCGNQCDQPVPNTSDNGYFRDVVRSTLSRRDVLRAGATAGLVLGTSGVAVSTAAAAPARPSPANPRGAASISLGYAPVPPNRLDTVVVPNGYDWEVVIRWGDPVEKGAPRFDLDRQTPQAQAKQFGYNCDYVAMLPLGPNSALLVVSHEYTNEQLMFRGYTTGAAASTDEIRIAMAAHGLTVVEVQRIGVTGRWRTKTNSPYNRRIHTGSPMEITGPAAGSALLRTSADPTGTVALGTLNDCAGGTTPWGTTLHGEENFHQYFVNANLAPEALRPALARYGLPNGTSASSRRWDRVDSRFDLAQEPHEANRHGWIVELDPYDPEFVPRKRTALGRFKHEGATIALAADGRAVAYQGDDEVFEYVYKYVSHAAFDPGGTPAAKAHNLTLLDYGDLFVARLTGNSPAGEIDGSGALPSDGEFDGTGEWIQLTMGDQSLVPGMSIDEVLINTRLAADAVNPTKMDRPEDMEANPVNGRVYLALTNNSGRTVAAVDEANPLARSVAANGVVQNGNRNGFVLEIEEAGNDAAAAAFSWRLFLVCGDPAAAETYFGGFPKDQVSPISCPDNVAFDPDGNLWVSTDGNALGSNDGLFSVPVEGPDRGQVKQFLTVPIGAETCGPVITEDGKNVFVAVQHPGELTGASVENPLSTFPDGDFPRPSVVVAWNTGRG